MGYRHYLYLVEKSKIDVVSAMTEADAKAASERDEGIRELIAGKCVHEFGKYINKEIFDGIHGHSVPLFLDKAAADYFNDYDAVVTSIEGLEAAIDAQRKIILGNVTKDIEMSPEELHQSQRTTLSFKKIEWEEPFDWQEIKAKGRLPDSWLFEYSIFNLILLHETTDWKTHELVFMGW